MLQSCTSFTRFFFFIIASFVIDYFLTACTSFLVLDMIEYAMLHDCFQGELKCEPGIVFCGTCTPHHLTGQILSKEIREMQLDYLFSLKVR